MKLFYNYLIVLSSILFFCNPSIGQSIEDSINYDTEFDGGLIEHIIKPDDYELDSVVTFSTITVNVNEKAGIDNLTFGESYSFQLSISNELDADVLILGFSRPCLCIQTDWHKTPLTPGAIGFVSIKYTATIIGPSQKVLTAYLFDISTMKAVAKANIILQANVANIINSD